MPIAYVTNTQGSNSGTVSVSLVANATASSVSIAVVRWNDYNTGTGITETLGGWAKSLDFSGPNDGSGNPQRIQVFWARNGAANGTVSAGNAAAAWQTLTYTGLAPSPQIPIFPVSGEAIGSGIVTSIPVSSILMGFAANWLLTVYTAAEASANIIKDALQTARRANNYAVGTGVSITTADDPPATAGASGVRTGTIAVGCQLAIGAQIVLREAAAPPLAFGTKLFTLSDMI